MAQTFLSEYLEPSSKMEKIIVPAYLEIYKEKQVNREEELCESDDEICTDGECVIDGILNQNTRGSYMKDKECHVLIQGICKRNIKPLNIRPKRRGACMSSLASEITIYYYRSNILKELEKRIPVLLNISDNEFLKCSFTDNKAVLTVENLEKERLDLIYKNDQTAWPFVFFLSSTKDNYRRFESAQCSGWFIRTESDFMCMDEHKDEDPEKYLFIIKSFPNASKSK